MQPAHLLASSIGPAMPALVGSVLLGEGALLWILAVVAGMACLAVVATAVVVAAKAVGRLLAHVRPDTAPARRHRRWPAHRPSAP